MKRSCSNCTAQPCAGKHTAAALMASEIEMLSARVMELTDLIGDMRATRSPSARQYWLWDQRSSHCLPAIQLIETSYSVPCSSK
jgi:hypothetical protein